MFRQPIVLTACGMLTAVGWTARESRANTITDIVAASGGEFDRNRFDYDIIHTLNRVLIPIDLP